MPAISALYGGLYALLLLAFALPVSRMRRRLGIGIGDGGDAGLARAIRVHANAFEWGLPFLVLLLVAELNRAPPIVLHVCGIVFLIARLGHGVGLSRRSGYSHGRFWGIAATWAVLLALALWNVYAFLRLLLI